MPIWGWRGRPEYIHGKVIDTGRLGLEVKGTDDPGQLVAECSSAQLDFIRILLGLTVIAGGDQYARLARNISQGREARSEVGRSEEHTSELQSLMRISYAVFCLKKKKKRTRQHNA